MVLVLRNGCGSEAGVVVAAMEPQANALLLPLLAPHSLVRSRKRTRGMYQRVQLVVNAQSCQVPAAHDFDGCGGVTAALEQFGRGSVDHDGWEHVIFSLSSCHFCFRKSSAACQVLSIFRQAPSVDRLPTFYPETLDFFPGLSA